MARLPPLLLILLAALCASAENAITLPTELKLNTVTVSVQAPLGWRYRPGRLFPLELSIDNPSTPTDVEIAIVESGDASTGNFRARYTLPGPVTLPAGTSRFEIPLRAGSVSAGATLSISSRSSSGTKLEIFRASLSRILQPLPASGRLIVVCGGAAPHGPQDSTVSLTAHTLPDALWKWASVDWLILNDAAALEGAGAPARLALSRWLESGGRIFIGTRAALNAGLSAGWLLPGLKPTEIGSDLAWWRTNAHLTDQDILASHAFSPVYARLHRGFGQIVFLFPGADAAQADGAAVFNSPALQHPRARFDERIQPERFENLSASPASSSQSATLAWWSLLGAALLSAALLLSHGSRSRWEVLLVPLGAGALLSALLAHGYPPPALRCESVRVETLSPDGTMTRIEEWALLSAFKDSVETSISSSTQQTLTPIYEDSESLDAARVEFNLNENAMSLHKILVTAEQPVLVKSERIALTEKHANYPALVQSKTKTLALVELNVGNTEHETVVKAADLKAESPLAARLGLTHLQSVSLGWQIAAQKNSDETLRYTWARSGHSSELEIDGAPNKEQIPFVRVEPLTPPSPLSPAY